CLQIVSRAPAPNVIVLGDLNDFEFSETVQILKAANLHDLMESLPLNHSYSYEVEGNAQVLDHMLVSDALFARPSLVFDPVHVNAEFFDQASDHDPSVMRVTFNGTPSVSAGGPYTVGEGSSTTLTATGSDPDGDTLTHAWDLDNNRTFHTPGRHPRIDSWDFDNNGTFETPGQSVSFSAPDGPATPTVTVRATDPSGSTATARPTGTAQKVAPTATLQ